MGARGRGSETQSGDEGLADALASATWAEADRALAQALLDVAALEALVEAARRARTDAARLRRLEEAAAASLSARQSLASAARKRRLEVCGRAGESQPFNPLVHDCLDAEHPKMVRIVSPAIVRAVTGEAVLKAQTRAARRAGPKA